MAKEKPSRKPDKASSRQSSLFWKIGVPISFVDFQMMPSKRRFLWDEAQGFGTPPEIGNVVVIRLRAGDTAGSIGLVEVLDRPGEGPPPHVHGREDETFHILEGEYGFTCGGESF
jgi:mannose-6-phosphate isomerase-like protein (cupin superfamily)